MKARCKFCNGSGKIRQSFVRELIGLADVWNVPGLIYASTNGTVTEYDVVEDCPNCHVERATIDYKPRKYRAHGNYRKFDFRGSPPEIAKTPKA